MAQCAAQWSEQPAGFTASCVRLYLRSLHFQHLKHKMGKRSTKKTPPKDKKVRGYDSSKLAISSPELHPRPSLHAEQFELCCNCSCCFSLLVISTIEFDLITFTRGWIVSHSPLVEIIPSGVLTKAAEQSDFYSFWRTKGGEAEVKEATDNTSCNTLVFDLSLFKKELFQNGTKRFKCEAVSY